jgi:hypothetical protein
MLPGGNRVDAATLLGDDKFNGMVVEPKRLTRNENYIGIWKAFCAMRMALAK